MSKQNELMRRTRRMVLTALLFAAALVLSLLEDALPPLPIPAPGVKLGLSNIAVLYALLFLGAGPGLSIAVLKAGFALITRGAAAGFLSLCGGLLSVGVMLLLNYAGRGKCSVFLLSMSGAVAHNAGQFLGISVLYAGMNMLPYLPILILAGVGAGFATSVLLRAVLPALERLHLTDGPALTGPNNKE